MYGREEKQFKNETYQELNIKPTPNKNNSPVLIGKHQHFERAQRHERCLRASLQKNPHLCSNIYFGSQLKQKNMAPNQPSTAVLLLELYQLDRFWVSVLCCPFQHACCPSQQVWGEALAAPPADLTSPEAPCIPLPARFVCRAGPARLL